MADDKYRDDDRLGDELFDEDASTPEEPVDEGADEGADEGIDGGADEGADGGTDEGADGWTDGAAGFLVYVRLQYP